MQKQQSGAVSGERIGVTLQAQQITPLIDRTASNARRGRRRGRLAGLFLGTCARTGSAVACLAVL